MPHTLGILGAGNMAEAIVRAALAHDVLTAKQIIAADPASARREVFASLGVAVAKTNAAVIEQSEQVLLAVKPQMLDQPAADLAAHGRDGQIVISIMAGVTTAKLAAAVAGKGQRSEAQRSGGVVASPTMSAHSCGAGQAKHAPRIVRVMPNTPMMVGCGMAGIALGGAARRGDDDLAMRIFSAGDSQAIRVDEGMLDAVTAVSGSGPAYLFYLAEAMEKAAAELGLGQQGRLLVAQTLLGSARLLMQAGGADAGQGTNGEGEGAGAGEGGPAELRRRVTSPGGTTEAAIGQLDANQTIDAIVNAIRAAHARSEELGQQENKQ